MLSSSSGTMLLRGDAEVNHTNMGKLRHCCYNLLSSIINNSTGQQFQQHATTYIVHRALQFALHLQSKIRHRFTTTEGASSVIFGTRRHGTTRLRGLFTWAGSWRRPPRWTGRSPGRPRTRWCRRSPAPRASIARWTQRSGGPRQSAAPWCCTPGPSPPGRT